VDYWNECIREAFEDAGLVATKDQIDIVAGWVEGAHDNYGMAYGHDCIPNPLSSEIEKIKREMVRQQEAHERQLNGIRKGVAHRRNADIGGVVISDDGEVTYGE